MAPTAWRRQRELLHLGALLFSAILIFTSQNIAYAADTAEAQPRRMRPTKAESELESVIAKYLLNFIKYTDWPEAVPPPDEPWRIGVLNNERVFKALEDNAKERKIKDRLIVVVHASDVADLSNCQIVLLPSSVTPTDDNLSAFVKRPVLTVYYGGETAHPPVAAVIELTLQNQTMRYRVNSNLLVNHGLRATPGLIENSLPQATTQPPRTL
jgi:hypothetical protein